MGTMLALIMGTTLLTGCFGEKNNPEEEKVTINIEDVVEKIKSEVSLRSTEKVNDELATEKFHLNLDDVESYVIENGMINSGLETIAIVEAKDEKKANDVSESFKKVIGDKKSQVLYPGEDEALKEAKVVEEDNYVGLFIIPDYEKGENNAEKAAEIFESYFK